MAERYRLRSALAHLGIETRVSSYGAGEGAGEGVVLGERGMRGMLALRGVSASAGLRSAISAALGFGPVVEPLTSARLRDVSMLWLGPDEWLVVMPDRRLERVERTLRTALDGQHAALTDVSHSRIVFTLAGPDAVAVLAKGCPLDFHPRAFPPGRCAQSRLAKCHALIHLLNRTPEFEIYVPRSFAEYAWTWLEDAAGEFGVRIAAVE